MQVIVNYPDTNETIKAFNDKFALFHATLLLEKIQNMDINIEDKEKIFKTILDIIKGDFYE